MSITADGDRVGTTGRCVGRSDRLDRPGRRVDDRSPVPERGEVRAGRVDRVTRRTADRDLAIAADRDSVAAADPRIDRFDPDHVAVGIGGDKDAVTDNDVIGAADRDAVATRPAGGDVVATLELQRVAAADRGGDALQLAEQPTGRDPQVTRIANGDVLARVQSHAVIPGAGHQERHAGIDPERVVPADRRVRRDELLADERTARGFLVTPFVTQQVLDPTGHGEIVHPGPGDDPSRPGGQRELVIATNGRGRRLHPLDRAVGEEFDLAVITQDPRRTTVDRDAVAPCTGDHEAHACFDIDLVRTTGRSLGRPDLLPLTVGVELDLTQVAENRVAANFVDHLVIAGTAEDGVGPRGQTDHIVAGAGLVGRFGRSPEDARHALWRQRSPERRGREILDRTGIVVDDPGVAEDHVGISTNVDDVVARAAGDDVAP